MLVETAPPQEPMRGLQRARSLRRAYVLALAVFLAAGATGAFGVRTQSASASGGGWRLAVRYPAVARPGLAIAWGVEVHRPGGFDGPVRIATSSQYLELFDENGLDPGPASATATATDVVWTFDPPDGDTLVVSFDARIEPGVQWGRTGRTAVLDGGPSVTYRTFVMP